MPRKSINETSADTPRNPNNEAENACDERTTDEFFFCFQRENWRKGKRQKLIFFRDRIRACMGRKRLAHRGWTEGFIFTRRGDLYKWIIIIHPRRCALRLAQLFSLPLSQIHRTFNLRLSDFLIARFPRSHSAVPNRSSPPKQRQKEFWDLCWATSHTKKVPPFIKISHLFIDGEGVPVSYNSISFSRALEKGDAECSSEKNLFPFKSARRSLHKESQLRPSTGSGDYLRCFRMTAQCFRRRSAS